MIRSLNTGVGGIRNYQTSLDVIANNLANLNTVGYKGGRVDFAEALTQTVRPTTPDEGNTSGTSSVAVSNGVATNAVTTIFGQGAINQTGKITDLALAGDGYFILKKYGTPSIGDSRNTTDFDITRASVGGIAQPDSGDKGAPGGISYATRAGDFRLDKNGNLVNNMGMRVQGISNSINNPGEIGDIKLDRGEFMSSVDVLRGSTDDKTVVMAKAHGFKTGNIVIFKSDSEMPGNELQEATPYYVRVVDENKLLLYDNLHAASTDENKLLAKKIPANEVTNTGMRIIKKLASYEGVHTEAINEEYTITSGATHGLKDGDKVRFYVPNAVSVITDTMTAGENNTWSFKVSPQEYLSSMEKGKVLNFGAGKEFVISEVAENRPQPNEDVESYTITGSVARFLQPDLSGETKFSMAPITSLLTTTEISAMGKVNVDGDEWSFQMAKASYDQLAPISPDLATVLDFGVGKEMRVTNVIDDGSGSVKIFGNAVVADADFSGITRLSHEGYTKLSNLDDQDASGGFSQSFYVSVKGEKAFSLHNSSEDAFSRTRAVNIQNGSLYNSSIVKVAASTTAQIQNVNVDTAGRVNVMLTDGTQYTRAQILLRKFTNQQALDKEGGNMYSNLENAGVSEWSTPGSDGFARIESGALELSNVDVAREFSKLISTQRAFQANARMVSASDQILQELLRLKR